jgi:23S rRNA (cytidine1920-2'-O)/16S rRNA (cytidine1409-2'-O)-methyltransferase
MVKPQFELGRGRVGRGGVVREPALRREAIRTVAASAAALGWSVVAAAPSGLPGPKGNRETFLHLAEPGRGGVDDLDALALGAEPDGAAPAGAEPEVTT